MIYTTYFAKLRSLPEGITPIAICAKPPKGFKGFVYKSLAPKYDFFKHYKETGDTEYFKKCYYEQILNNIQPGKLLEELYKITGSSGALALVCFEKSTDFCHRHLVAEWLNNFGITCEEFL